MKFKLSILFFLTAVSIFAQDENNHPESKDFDVKNEVIESKNIKDLNKDRLINEAKSRLEVSKLTQSALGHIRSKQFREAESIIKQIQELSGNSVDYHYLKGALAYSYMHLTDSIGHLELALKINNTHDPSLFLIGLCHARRTDWTKALVYFEKANYYSPYNPFYRMNLAIAHFNNEQFDKSALEAKQTLELKENYTYARVILIKSLIRIGRKEDAYQQAKDMIEKKIEVANVYPHYLQMMYEARSDYAGIIKELEKKKHLDFEEKRLLALSYFKEAEYSKSISLFKQILGTEKDSEEDLLVYLKMLILVGKENEAEKHLGHMIRSNPSRKKVFIDTYKTYIEQKEVSKSLYQPIVVR